MAVEALLRSSHIKGRAVFVESGRHEGVVALAESRGVPVERLSREAIVEKAGYPFHRGIFAEAIRPPAREPDPDFLSRSSRLLIPYGLADGGNLGTLIRSGVAFGVDGIIVQKDHGADVFSRISIRASATAVFRVPIFEVEDLTECLRTLQEETFTCCATRTDASRRLADFATPPKSAILLGAEKDGLPDSLRPFCDESLSIPMHSGMDSLNVAVSGSIVLHELFGRD